MMTEYFNSKLTKCYIFKAKNMNYKPNFNFLLSSLKYKGEYDE